MYFIKNVLFLLVGNFIKKPFSPSKQMVEHLIEHDGLTRRFLENRPASYGDGGSGSSAVILLHGALESMYQSVLTRSWFQLSNQEGFLLIAPNAVSRLLGNPAGCAQFWNDYNGLGSEKIDDVGFLEKLVDWIKDNRNADHIFLIGVSNGGMMLMRFLVEANAQSHAAVTAAVTIVSSLPLREIPNPPETTPLMMVAGTEDPVVNYNGGKFGFGLLTPLRSLNATLDFWITANHADRTNVVRTTLPDIWPYDNCTIRNEYYPADTSSSGEATPVSLFTVEGGGHFYFETPDVSEREAKKLVDFLPTFCGDMDATQLSWEFMRSTLATTNTGLGDDMN